MIYPRPMRTISQIELTTHCNLKCVYCPSPYKPRPHTFMAEETLERALVWIRYFYDKPAPLDWPEKVLDVVAVNSLPCLMLHGIGESLMHPRFFEFAARIRETIPDTMIGMSSNGILLTKETCAKLARLRISVNISMHRPDLIKDGLQNALAAGIMHAASNGPIIEPTNWAGQVNWPVNSGKSPCTYLNEGWGIILVDGQITTCCVDASNKGIIGNIADEPRGLPMKPYSLCPTCDRVP